MNTWEARDTNQSWSKQGQETVEETQSKNGQHKGQKSPVAVTQGQRSEMAGQRVRGQQITEPSGSWKSSVILTVMGRFGNIFNCEYHYFLRGNFAA